ncbi:GNAT family N-acetyltransferase [Rheinheimera sp. MMS21-TC3]|uniref:GNAT family N-acetyltransferase n=1 Tax=Rheinheimera sp. MMS21-TC3 TaxID=3072790 RepID=UPI0028C3F5A0|nr:GNAT family N-acetyltransferase [Rheinheimera sp. MMS21-TC3]WNO62018.1 GNAT family N-acetyltransferase [Rheinheimera sp. MMS21-TC3]
MSSDLNSLTLDKITAAMLTAEDIKSAASLLYLAYYDDPLFMKIFRANESDYELRLRAAIREELTTFWQAQQPMIGVFNQQQLLGVACLTEPNTDNGERLWHWRLKMLLTAGYVSTKQLLEKEQSIHSAMPVEHYHMLVFLAVSPKHQSLGLGHYLLHAVNSIVDKNADSAGVGVFVTLDKYKSLFADNSYKTVTQLSFNNVSGYLMFRPKQSALST